MNNLQNLTPKGKH